MSVCAWVCVFGRILCVCVGVGARITSFVTNIFFCNILVAPTIASMGGQGGQEKNIKPPKYLYKVSLKNTIHKDQKLSRFQALDQKPYFFRLNNIYLPIYLTSKDATLLNLP